MRGCVCCQLLRSSLVNNRTQAIICDDLGMTQYVINNDQTVKERIDNECNKVKDKADIIEGLCVVCIVLLLILNCFHSMHANRGKVCFDRDCESVCI